MDRSSIRGTFGKNCTNYPLHQGLYAFAFREEEDHVEVTAIEVDSGRRRLFRTPALPGNGAINSTRLMARSLGWVQRPIRLLDSQYFFFPLISYLKAPQQQSFTLAELFIEVLNARVGPYYTHFQVYGLNSIFRQTITAFHSATLPPAVSPEGVGREVLSLSGFSTFGTVRWIRTYHQFDR